MNHAHSLALSLVIFIVLAGISGASTVVGSGTPETHISVVPTNYDPYPAESGQYMRIWIKLENLGTSAEQNARFKLVPNYPFSFDPTETGERNVGTIDVTKQVVIDYNLRVDALALTGNYNNSLWLRQCYDTMCSTSYVSWPIEIFVRRPNPIIEINSVATSPETVVPGDKFTLNIGLNGGGSRVKDVALKLDLSSMPFGPLDASTEKQVQSIGVDENVTVPFSMIAIGSAQSGAYKIPVTMTYSDEVGNSFNKSDTITLLVGGTPYVYVGAEDIKYLRKDSVTDFVINIINKGLVDLKLLTVKILPSDTYRILSPDEVYVGGIKSDDYETAKFKVYVNSAPEQVTLQFELNYMDTLNNRYNETKQLTYAVLTKDEAARFGLEKQESPLPYVIVLLLLVGFAIYRMRKKKKIT